MDEGKHTFYALHGSPIKAYVVKRRRRLHFYDSDGSRWATWTVKDIKNDISKTEKDLEAEWED
jgi:hypothetical protein